MLITDPRELELPKVGLVDLLDPYVGHGAEAEDRLIEVERRNLARFGYGVKAFTLSMIETALDSTM